MRVLTRAIAIFGALIALTGCNEPGFPAHLKAETVSENGFQALLVTPRTNEPLNTVLILGGSQGGYGSVATAQKLAEAGFAALAVAYFGEPGLPQSLNSIPLEYFDAAIDYIDRNPRLHRNTCDQVPVLGASRGAELALLLASVKSAYGPVVAIAPSSHVWGAIGDSSSPAWTFAGAPITYVPRHSAPDYDVERFVGRDYFAEDLRHPDAVPAQIAVEDIAGQILLISGTDDRLWPGDEMADSIVARLQAHGKARLVQHLKYEGAGHAISPGDPAAATEVSLSGGQTIVLGGSEAANRQAQDNSWPVIEQLLRDPVCRMDPVVVAPARDVITAVEVAAQAQPSAAQAEVNK
ncbi:acyl-CoA thioester hydrolase/BAAT C-terminal domain-containing protein [Pseudidiomarina sp.]|uniref:acyl-CoA thioester hydrolase/BAAT C-terminal domain-containing protein n=1 Tax=Pseudidiomarina sp. TaxID=2081707 RepID=UPI00299DBCBB|nr:acyl-CoA thioester hydrolase/BAAT C-terminal domain-containing protein [Pseudidiomarina sp.]MDX1706554.1 acyl-CoA thioester hydrolase/BAAT C-terminal domain-containing protein [Pseudidiomarina sp.]